MTHEELLAKINHEIIGNCQNCKTCMPWVALRTVVELHKAIYDPKYNVTLCDNTGCWGYPCPTIQAIEKELA